MHHVLERTQHPSNVELCLSSDSWGYLQAQLCATRDAGAEEHSTLEALHCQARAEAASAQRATDLACQHAAVLEDDLAQVRESAMQKAAASAKQEGKLRAAVEELQTQILAQRTAASAVETALQADLKRLEAERSAGREGNCSFHVFTQCNSQFSQSQSFSTVAACSCTSNLLLMHICSNLGQT